MKLIRFEEKFKDNYFNVELSTGKVLKKVMLQFPSDEAEGFVLVKEEDDYVHIVNISHIVKISPYINTDIPLFSFS